jgi:hypothetical protein
MTIDALWPSGPRNVFLGGSVSTRIDWPDSTAGIGAVTPRRAASLAQPASDGAVFSVDEKRAIQALDRLDPVSPLSPGRAECHGFQYCPSRHSLALRRP